MVRIENVPDEICRRARDLQYSQRQQVSVPGSLAELQNHQRTRASWSAIFREVGELAKVPETSVYWSIKLQGFYTVTYSERSNLSQQISP